MPSRSLSLTLSRSLSFSLSEYVFISLYVLAPHLYQCPCIILRIYTTRLSYLLPTSKQSDTPFERETSRVNTRSRDPHQYFKIHTLIDKLGTLALAIGTPYFLPASALFGVLPVCLLNINLACCPPGPFYANGTSRG